MGVVEAGHHEASAQIDDFGRWAFELLDFFVGSRRADFAIGDSEGLHALVLNRANPRILPAAFCYDGYCTRINVTIDKDQVRGLRRLCAGEIRHSCGCEQQDQQSHSFTPVRVNKVSSMRLSPRSRLVQSNHSRRVCAPPPSPPVPMVVASLPNAMGILASVEATRGTDLIPKCASTAPTTCMMRASAGDSEAGRSPVHSI